MCLGRSLAEFSAAARSLRFSSSGVRAVAEVMCKLQSHRHFMFVRVRVRVRFVFVFVFVFGGRGVMLFVVRVRVRD